MFSHFLPRHIPPLLLATAITIGGTMPLWNAENAIRTFGFNEKIAVSKSAHPVMISGSARVTAVGLALWGLYLGDHFEAMDVVIASLGYLAVVDGYVCWKHGVPGSVAFRTISAGVISLWGFFGMTTGR
ncbi:uncharacterized protein EAF01_008714 [Botrytis porri]|uniref:Uncharacterized protein n=1 Tax=Botrytis porri TaxID=87229 RepID=A0A4Z1KTQ0_9HELO|nr:uncharacterized protein EAF01_008714 [Botrytis porri]KAF7897748.1 hypothetical protein EAF01_008714 [Botrytis porri]TGO87889.1 hypothetical protein BPOR_0197g00090 [Botrytis porri]